MTRTLTAEPTVAAQMTRCPISVGLDATFHDIAAILSGNRIGAVPVLDDRGRLAGVVSEFDLIRAGVRTRHDMGALTARGLITGSPRTMSPDVPLTTAARLLGAAGKRRVFVVEDGVVLLVGRVEWRSALAGIVPLVRAVPGVVEVRNRIRYVWDDVEGSGR